MEIKRLKSFLATWLSLGTFYPKPENRTEPTRTAPKYRFFRLFGSVSVSVLGNFGFGGRLRF